MRTIDENRRAWIALNLVPMRPLHRWQLARECGGPDKVLSLGPDRLQAILGARSDAPGRICGTDWLSRADVEIRHAERNNIDIFTVDSSRFPSPLRGLPDPPVALYVQGSLRPADELSVAVVGSREATQYGRGVAEGLGRDLSRAGVTVVSGLAYGIDAAAHRGALLGGGRTIAVLGTGLDVLYPKGNVALRRQIARQGALVSEFPFGVGAARHHFPQRNRLIAGLTLGTVVVEAAARSGALITAEHANEFGREVFAVPGHVTSDRSDGTHALLRDGAGLVTGASDILESLPEPWGPRFRGERREGDPEVPWRFPVPVDLPEEEARVLSRLGADEPVPVDRLSERLGLPLGTLLDALVSLEVRRLVRALPGGRYVRTSPERKSKSQAF